MALFVAAFQAPVIHCAAGENRSIIFWSNGQLAQNMRRTALIFVVEDLENNWE
jgi:hypothetical protein